MRAGGSRSAPSSAASKRARRTPAQAPPLQGGQRLGVFGQEPRMAEGEGKKALFAPGPGCGPRSPAPPPLRAPAQPPPCGQRRTMPGPPSPRFSPPPPPLPVRHPPRLAPPALLRGGLRIPDCAGGRGIRAHRPAARRGLGCGRVRSRSRAPRGRGVRGWRASGPGRGTARAPPSRARPPPPDGGRPTPPPRRTRLSGSSPAGKRAKRRLRPGARSGRARSAARRAARRPASSPSKQSTGSSAARQRRASCSSPSAVPRGGDGGLHARLKERDRASM